MDKDPEVRTFKSNAECLNYLKAMDEMSMNDILKDLMRRLEEDAAQTALEEKEQNAH